MSNIFADLELPVNVVINFDFKPKMLRDKVARKLEENEMCAEVRRAIQMWYYETYC